MRKILFAAIIGYTGEITRDGRILMATQNDYGHPRLNHRPFPLPVMGPVDSKWAGKQVGFIEMAALCDRRIIIFGQLSPAEELKDLRWALATGSHFLEMDLTEIEAQDEDDTFRITNWSLAGVTVGMGPCWYLPRVQIEEINFKETQRV